jgi:hypothetical protein
VPLPQSTQGYHFPPPEPQPSYGYSNPQLLAAQQWGQQPDPQAYQVNYNQAYDNDPSPFHQAHHHQHQQGYADPDPDYDDEFYEDEEPRRGRRWLLIAAALIGAIGVGGALAYTYRSLVAPHVGRVPLVKADPNIKVKPDQRSGKDVASAERRLPTRAADETPTAGQETASEGEASSENLGPRAVKTIPITSGTSSTSAPAQQLVTPVIPGITLYQPPATTPTTSTTGAPPQTAPKAAPPQTGRIALGTRPQPSPSETDDDPPATGATVPMKRPATQAPAVAPRTAAVAPPVPRAREAVSSSGLGYVAVLSSQKSYLKALEIFADLQQKYGDVLGSKTPDVQEADLSSRGLGTMYRLVVGPPGSHTAAQGVCSQLKTAGYEGCWVKEY